MPIEFDAKYVHVSKEAWGWLVTWSVDENLAAERYVMLQAADKYSAEDARLGMDDIYIECCNQGWSWYGHIQAFKLSRTHIDVQLDHEAAGRMRSDGRFVVGFSIDDEAWGKLQRALEQVFAGRGYYSEA
ncbi:Imm10 family immunity protein [Steroidobacter sp.]|uniref:Imm10 family immunity protein n=1 Tax=Steroidobacter sp. TaxID=1978227 RepID=UPI001A485DA0|nr:Imm10 family immunity protein [Steroidobacter sp.]MBL8264984.1 hypothetical protein [Steroidobacter sp.]